MKALIFALSTLIVGFQSFLMGATPYQQFTEGMTSRFTMKDDLLEDVDIVSLEDNGYYGLPWNYFLNPTNESFPVVWKDNLDEIKNWLGEKPVFLSLQMSDSNGCPTKNATVDEHGHLVSKRFKPCDGCFNFSEHRHYRKAFIDYVLYLLDFYKPQYINYAVEITQYRTICGLELFEGFMDFANEVYDAVHEKHGESIPAFPSLLNANLYSGDPCTKDDNITSCTLKHLEETKKLKRDRFALSAYPFLISAVINQPLEITKNLVSSTLDLVIKYKFDKSVMIVETGTSTTQIVVDKSPDPYERSETDCFVAYPSNMTSAIDYMNFIFQLGEKYEMEMVCVFSYYDSLPEELLGYSLCPCLNSSEEWKLWCDDIHEARAGMDPPRAGEFFEKAFGSMGMKSYDTTTPNELYYFWKQWREKRK